MLHRSRDDPLDFLGRGGLCAAYAIGGGLEGPGKHDRDREADQYDEGGDPEHLVGQAHALGEEGLEGAGLVAHGSHGPFASAHA